MMQYGSAGPYLGHVGAEKAGAALHEGSQNGLVQHSFCHPGIQAGKGVVQEDHWGRRVQSSAKRAGTAPSVTAGLQ